jgi:hypothetical protein
MLKNDSLKIMHNNNKSPSKKEEDFSTKSSSTGYDGFYS